MEFIRRFLQHVLPTGFMKVRYYGFLHLCSSILLGYLSVITNFSIASFQDSGFFIAHVIVSDPESVSY